MRSASASAARVASLAGPPVAGSLPFATAFSLLFVATHSVTCTQYSTWLVYKVSRHNNCTLRYITDNETDLSPDAASARESL